MTTLWSDSTNSGITINMTTVSIKVDKFNGTLSAKESSMLSAYNKDINQLIKKVKKQPNYTNYTTQTYYLLLIEQSNNASLAGFLPVNSNFGFCVYVG